MIHMTMSNLISDGRKSLQDAKEVVNTLLNDGEDYLIKYRDPGEFRKYPSTGNIISKSGQGRLLDYCNPDTIVIGNPGSSMMECLINDINFFSFSNYEKHIANPSFNIYTNNLLHVARNKTELLENIQNNKIYKDGYSKNDLLHHDGIYLDEIVSLILSKKLLS